MLRHARRKAGAKKLLFCFPHHAAENATEDKDKGGGTTGVRAERTASIKEESLHHIVGSQVVVQE